jgi:hypothetical protein
LVSPHHKQAEVYVYNGDSRRRPFREPWLLWLP